MYWPAVWVYVSHGGGLGGGGEGGGEGGADGEVPVTASTATHNKRASWTGQCRDRSDLRRVFWAAAGVREFGCLAVPFWLGGSQVSTSAFLTLGAMLRQSVATTAKHSRRKLQQGLSASSGVVLRTCVPVPRAFQALRRDAQPPAARRIHCAGRIPPYTRRLSGKPSAAGGALARTTAS